MSTVYSIAQRSPAINSLFAGLACAIALTVTTGPALAQPGEVAQVAAAAVSSDVTYRVDVAEKR